MLKTLFNQNSIADKYKNLVKNMDIKIAPSRMALKFFGINI